MPAPTPDTPPPSDIAATLWADVATKRLGSLADYVARFGAARESATCAAYEAVTAALWEGVAVVQSPAADLPPAADRPIDRPAVLADPDVGRRVGPWILGRELGRGGQGAVYLAEDPRLRRRAAVKILTATDFTGDAFDRFRREAAIASRLDHPGICAVYDVGLEGRTPYIAMRYVEGETLAHRLAVARARTSAEGFPDGDPHSHVELPATSTPPAAPASPAAARPSTAPASRASGATPSTQVEIHRIVRLFEQAARALHAAHEAGVIHRDLKPGNLIVTADGEPVILDFGLAKDTSGVEVTMTRHGDLMGTPAYMSPEQLVAHRIKLDRRTDVYSLGVTLYECLTLRRPFDAPTREGIYQAILTREPQDPRTLNRSIPADLRVVLETALDKDRERRYATALDFAEDLRRVRALEPIKARPAGPLLRLRRWSQRNRGLAAALFALFVALSAGFVVTVTLLNKTTAALNAYDRLSAVPQLAKLKAQIDDLWPPLEENHVPRNEWLKEAEALAATLPEHEAALAALQRSGAYLEENSSSGDGLGELDDLTFGALMPKPPPRPAVSRYRLDDPANQRKHDVLAQFVPDLRDFVQAAPIFRQLQGMRRQAKLSDHCMRARDARYADRWRDAIASIADPAQCPLYGGLRIKPQFGLIPIGRNPQSGLWEFLHIPTTGQSIAAIPAHKSIGDIDFKAEYGVVLVLIPGGEGWIGSMPLPINDPRGGHEAGSRPRPIELEGMANSAEQPRHLVRFAPFFLSKYELARSQWLRTTGENAEADDESIPPPETDARMPASMINWYSAMKWCRRNGLALPSESQWEYACRAGTTTEYWAGNSAADLARVGWILVNSEGQTEVVGEKPANAWGLRDVHGNVWEWCEDVWHQSYDGAPDDGRARSGPPTGSYVVRGGGFGSAADAARSAVRTAQDATAFAEYLGFRPAMPVAR
jgi:formylglycine-generating enzyme required for sulfatase activity/serine/threonine protein kinase